MTATKAPRGSRLDTTPHATLQPAFSSLELVKRVDTWPYPLKDLDAYKVLISEFYYFMIDDHKKPFGYVHRSFVESMTWPPCWRFDHTRRFLTLMGSGFDHLTESIQYTLQQAYDAKHPRLPKWWDEKFALESLDGEHVLDMDGCGVDLFGIITFGVFLIAYVRTDDGLKYWIQKRAMSKRVWPGKLDTVAAGSVKPQEKAFEAVVREAGEEAGFSQEYTRANIRSCGVLTFQLASTNAGDPGAQHHVQYIYEMEVQPDMIPYPVDGEVEEFKLISLEEVIDAVVKDEFKLNLVMVWVDYLIRHGIVTAENEKDFLEVSARLHRKFDLFVLDEPCSHL